MRQGESWCLLLSWQAMLGVDTLRVSRTDNTVYQRARGVHTPGCSGQPPRVTWTNEEARGNKECLEKEAVTMVQQSLSPSTVSSSTPSEFPIYTYCLSSTDKPLTITVFTGNSLEWVAVSGYSYGSGIHGKGKH